MRNRNDLDAAIASAVREGSSVYTLRTIRLTPIGIVFPFHRVHILAGPSSRTQRGYYAIRKVSKMVQTKLNLVSRERYHPIPFEVLNSSPKVFRFLFRLRFAVSDSRFSGLARNPPPLIHSNRSSGHRHQPRRLVWTAQPNGDRLAEFALVTSSVSAQAKFSTTRFTGSNFTLRKSF